MSIWNFKRFLLNENTGNTAVDEIYHVVNIAIIIVVLLLIAICFFLVLKLIIKLVRKSKIKNKYGIKVPFRFKIKRNRTKVTRKYELDFPKWLYSNKDGSKNKVRKNNVLVYYPSNLYYENFIIVSKTPMEMIDLVSEIRDTLGEDAIPKNKQEVEKYNYLRNKYESFRAAVDIQSIIDKYRDEPNKFEEYCGHLYTAMGYDVKVTPKTNDGGYDLILHKNKDKMVVECKCYAQKHSIGRPLIQKLVGANQIAQADRLAFITTSSFSKEAVDYAQEMNVELIDGENLLILTKKYFKDSSKPINISKEEWELNEEDILRYYPKDYLD